jgi:glycerate dehydrogenase
MERPLANILVTFSADEELRPTILATLSGSGDVVFLSDIPTQKRSRELRNADAIISWNLESELEPPEFETISNVGLLQLLSAGADHVPFSRISPNIMVATNSGAYAEPMAEHVLAMTLATFKNLFDRHSKLAKGVFDHTNENRILRGSTCAILGFGGIGKATARLLRCFGVRIFAINSSGKTDEDVEFIGTLKDLEYVLQLADVVVIALPLTTATRGLIGKRELAWMKNDATLINVARGEIIREDALFERLKLYPSFHAAIDAWWVEPFHGGEFHTTYPFLELPNVLGSPHNSGLVPGSMVTGATRAAENVKRYLNRQAISGEVKRSDYLQGV